MKEPRFKVGQQVLTYRDGKLVDVIILKIRIEISSDKTEISYQFEEDRRFSGIGEWFTDEAEIFETRDDFIKNV